MTRVLFDLDGTLVDSAPDLRLAVNRVLDTHGRRPLTLDEVRAFVGHGSRHLVRRAFDATGAPTHDLDARLAEYLAQYAEHVCTKTRLYPGATEVLRRLADAGHALGLCTNKPQAHTRALLGHLDLARFFGDAVVGGDTTPHTKPHPEPIVATLRLLDRPASHAVLIGDSPSDVGAARAAGIPVVAVSWGYSHGPVHELGADRIIDHFDQLPDAIAALV